ncbi:MAG: hypothetical protein AAFQ83_22225 [Bacteroidota bacterium]
MKSVNGGWVCLALDHDAMIADEHAVAIGVVIDHAMAVVLLVK